MSQTPDTALVAEPERRFQAFVIDQLTALVLCAVAGVGAWWWFFREEQIWAGVGLLVAAALVVGVGLAVLLGLSGSSPGKSLLGLRVVSHDTGTPIGVGRALLRALVLGLGGLPTAGLGVATLAWTAVEDRSGQRRGWHDQVAGSVVLDVRPRPVAEVEEDQRPRHVVNLTALKLVPVPQPSTPARQAPVEPTRPPEQTRRPQPAPATQAAPATAAEPTPRPAGPPAPNQSPSASAPPSAPAPASAPTPVPTPAPQSPEARGADATVASARPPTPAAAVRWRVTFDTGESFVVEGLGVVGRAPSGRPGEPVRHVVPLRSENMSISKTHAQFHLATDGALVVMDRGSTNGSLLLRKGVSRELAAGRPATLVDGDRVVFGDRQMKVSRETS